MEFTGERYVPSQEGQIKYEHIHRYALCLPIVANRAVLDLASGEGYGAALLSDVAASVTGVDISQETVQHARHHYCRKNLRFLVGSCDKVPLPDASVDVVTSFETIEHHDKHDEMMQEMKRVLKPDGILVISSPNRLTYSEEPKYSNPFHIKELYFDEFSALLEDYFKHVMIYGQRLATASFVHPLHNPQETQLTSYSGSAESVVQKASSLRSPIYFVSVCSDDPAICATSSASVYIDASDDLMRKASVRTENEIISQSTAYEAQLARQTEELSQVRAAYEAQLKRQTDDFSQAQSLSGDQLDQLSHEISNLRSGYEAQLAQVAQLTNEKAGYESRIRNDMDKFSQERSTFEAQLVRQKEELCRSQAEYEMQLNRLKDALNEAQASYEAQVKQQADLVQHLHQQDELLEKARTQLSTDEKQIQDYRWLLSEAHAQVSKTSEVLNWIYASRSWRLSTKLRQIELSQRWDLLEQKIRRRLVSPSREVFQGSLDFPKAENILSDSLEIDGWVYSTAASVTRVEAFLNDVYLGSIRYGIERPDVVAAFPGKAPLVCGYKERISLRGLGIIGEKRLKVRVYDEKGNRRFYTRTVTLEVPSAMLLPPAIDISQTKITGTLKDLNTLIDPGPAANTELSRQMEKAITEFQNRKELDPAILDWNSGLQLASSFPHLAVFSPVLSESIDHTLPYLDSSIDIVVTSSSDPAWLSEARRVAGVAVIRIRNFQSDKLQHLTPYGAGKSSASLDIEWLTGQADEPLLPVTSIVIPVYNKVSYTQRCLEQLSTTLPHDFNGEIIIVDDSSSDETPAVLEHWAEADGRIKILRNAENAGFIVSCNRGAEAAQGDILVFLNNDTLPLSGWLPPLLRVFRDKPEAGAVGGKLVYPNGTLQEAGGIIFSDGSGCNFGKHDNAANAPLYNFMREVDYCSGALLATRRALFMELGGFDERFKPAYYEDTDYCFSLRENGYRVYYQPESVIVHFEGTSSGTDINTGVKSYQAVNRTKFVEKWHKALKHHYPAPTQYDAATLHTLSRRYISENGHGN